MRYCTTDGLNGYIGDDAFEKLEARFGDDEALERAVAECETRVLAYCIPNTPCAEQIASFERAVYMQFEYEQSSRNAQLADMPEGIRSFTVNGFSASFEGMGGAFMSYGICKGAKAELALCGLLYRGVNCSC